MFKFRVVIALLLAVVLVFPLNFMVPAVIAEDGQPGEGVEGTPVLDGPPDLIGSHNGIYSETANLIFYDWDGSKYKFTLTGYLVVLCQNEHEVGVMGYTPGAPAGLPSIQSLEKAPGNGGCFTNGFVGPMVVDSVSGKPKNKPILSVGWYYYDVDEFYAEGMTARVKLDKYRNVKSIKGSGRAWLYSFNVPFGAQSEYKFTATPYFGPLGENGLPPGVELPPGVKLPGKPEPK